MDNFLGELRLFPYTFAPTGWARADGTLQQIRDNVALFSLLGTNYGGDGRSTYGLPNMTAQNPFAAQGGVGWCIALQGVFPPRP